MIRAAVLVVALAYSASAGLIAGHAPAVSIAQGPALGATLVGKVSHHVPELTVVKQPITIDQPEIRYHAVPQVVGVVEQPRVIVQQPKLLAVAQPKLVATSHVQTVQHHLVQPKVAVVEQPQVLVAQQKVLVQQPQVLVAQPKVLVQQPQVLVAQPKVLVQQPQLIATSHSHVHSVQHHAAGVPVLAGHGW